MQSRSRQDKWEGDVNDERQTHCKNVDGEKMKSRHTGNKGRAVQQEASGLRNEMGDNK